MGRLLDFEECIEQVKVLDMKKNMIKERRFLWMTKRAKKTLAAATVTATATAIVETSAGEDTSTTAVADTSAVEDTSSPPPPPSPPPDDFRLENWKRIWQCRDFELSHLWQRSIFLTAFLLLIYSSYGLFWKDQLFASDGGLIDSSHMHHIISMGISALGIVFSILWIAMGKGSKFWYEAYEAKIGWIEFFEHEEEGETKDYTKIDYRNRLNANDVSALVRREDIDPCLLSCTAAKYSPSKINIMIGIISLFVWVILFVIHLVFFIYKAGGWDLSKSTTIAPILGTIIFICGLCWMIDNIKSKKS